MSDHQLAANDLDHDGGAEMAPAADHRAPTQGASADLPELDFSRLERARASLDNAFRQPHDPPGT